ncbi:hypothetical protein CPB85DRAFT_290592 [Mucidula mucida]|nr:hypothetical protein CPB85DRAFT_290592 [Mucidula mucida]
MEAFSAPAYINSDDLKFLERRYWEHAHSDYDVQFVVMVLIKPTNPFRHLAPLIYLAQHPRVAMRNLIKIYTYPEQTSLRSFTYYTMMYYLLLNLVLALDSGASFDEVLARAALFHSRFRDSGPVNVSVGNEDPHTAFWYSSAPPAYQSPDLREAYNLRCFRLLVALYAIMKETTLRDIALGEDPYNSKLFSRGKTAFDKVTLVDVICRALNSIAVAFSDLDPSFATRDPPATLAHNPRASNTNHQAPGEPRRQLPTEIHRYIYSFLPIRLQSLVDLAATCKRLRVIYTPLIYVDPFPYPATSIEEICRLEARSSALATVLSLKPHLASHIRRLRVRVEGNISSHDVYTMKYPPLHLCLADSLTHLVELHLYVPSLCENCDSELEENNSLEVTCYLRTLDAIATIARRWPNLSSFSLLDLGADLSDKYPLSRV